MRTTNTDITKVLDSVFYGEHRYGFIVFELTETKHHEIRKVYHPETDSFHRVMFRKNRKNPDARGRQVGEEQILEPSAQDLVKCMEARAEWEG